MVRRVRLHDVTRVVNQISDLERRGDRFHHGYLATTAPEAHPLEDRLSAIPVTALWNPRL